ncbi:MAG: ABC transporter permease [Anaerolineae bacterium]|nr:ABC transporter permease [Anaerolineae bacterium]
MLRAIGFYFRYASLNLRRSLRWTIFAAFCIAAGVAAIVALRTLGLSIGDSLTDNVRANNHGDIRLSMASSRAMGFNFGGAGDEADTEVFLPGDMTAIEAWAGENDARLSAFLNASGLQVTAVDAVTVGRPQFVTAMFIDPATYPAFGEITLLDPPGAPLASAFTGGNDIVISQNLADSQSIAVGDTVRVSGTDEPFTVRGVVRTEQEAGISDLLAAFFGFAYLPLDKAPLLQQPDQPNVISIALPDGSTPEQITAAAAQLGPLTGASITTVNELLQNYSQIADILGRFIVIMGLGALLIGGVAIINTMLVLVGRRTTEIAALKTLGLKGRQVMAIFLTEAFILGIAGSLLGVGMGVLLSIGVNQYGAAFLQQPLTWRIYPEAILFGLAVGVVVTLVFGVLPVLVANKVRPATILRPNETVMPAAGCLQSLLALALVVIVVGVIAGNILSSIPAGIIGVAFTLALLGLLTAVLWVVVWLVSRFPSFGQVDLKLALRNLRARRIRTATTLLALAAGMFALSSITFVGAGTRELLNIQMAQQLGGNVLVFPLLGLVSPALAQTQLNLQLNGMDGIDYRTTLSTYQGRLTAINGETPQFPDIGIGRAERAFRSAPLQSRVTDNPNVQAPPLIAGRYLTAEDDGQPVIVVNDDFVARSIGVDVGSILTIRVDNRSYDFEVVGLASSGGFRFGPYDIPPGVIDGNPGFSLTVLSVSEENLNQVLLDLSANPTLLALDLTFIDGLLRRVIDQFAAIPTVVGLLSLLAAAVAMANTVALATLERRRQIGVMKAVGLKGRRVMGILLLENSVIGVLGGVLGIGLSALGVALLTSAGDGSGIPIPADAAPVAVALMAAAVAIAWIATFASARSTVREHVTEVLRYE